MRWAKILIADDLTLVAEGLKKLLEGHCQCVDMVNNGAALLRAVETMQPHLVLLDIAMPQLNGFEAAREIHRRYPHIKLVFVTVHREPEYVTEAFGAGASGYVVKTSGEVELIRGLNEVLRGRKFISESLPSLAANVEPGERRGKNCAKTLSPRQRQVLQLLCEGNSAKMIAHTLNISTKTVEFHKTAMMKAVGAQNSAELIRFGVENSVVGSLSMRSERWTAAGEGLML